MKNYWNMPIKSIKVELYDWCVYAIKYRKPIMYYDNHGNDVSIKTQMNYFLDYILEKWKKKQ